MPQTKDHAPLGATIAGDGVDFRVWSPDAARIDVDLRGGRLVAMSRDDDGVWFAHAGGIGAGAHYRFRVDDSWSYPDPYSRSQPDGVHGESEVIDPGVFRWTDEGWHGLTGHGLVIYELHIGAFTREGTFDAAAAQLDELAALGVTAIELMPFVEFPGERNWGYDGVDLFAPSHVYGGPEAMRRFVDTAHAYGIGVIVDAVYNHFGPDGNYLLAYARDYLTDHHQTPWGDAVNFDGERSQMVRRLVLDNVRHWMSEYHIDGMRIDAAFTFRDDSPRHILAEISATARAAVAPERSIVMIAETYENDVRYLRPESDGGLGFDAVWADDFHHTIHARVTNEHGGYYADYEGTLDELARTIEHGWLYEGQQSKHFGAARGTSARDVPAQGLVYCIQNHDQIANRAFGRRMSHGIDAEQYRAWSALLLLLPYTPMIFMGQEFVASTAFRYFTDHPDELGRAVNEGRYAEFAQNESEAERERRFPDPQAEEAFAASQLDLGERNQRPGRDVLALYQALLALRREDAVLREQDRRGLRARAVGDVLVVVMNGGEERRLIVVNTGDADEISLAGTDVGSAVAGRRWAAVVSTDEVRFGGEGRPASIEAGVIRMAPRSAAWFAAPT